MNISINISIKALQISMWSCFTNGRELPSDLKGYQLQYRHTDQTFSFALLKDNNVVVSKNIDRGHWQMTSADPLNYSPAFHSAWHEFINDCRKQSISIPQNNILIGAWIPEFFGNNRLPIPQESDNSRSKDVLIDLTGWRLTFRVGFFSYSQMKWELYDKNDEIMIDLEGLKWTHLPLNEK